MTEEPIECGPSGVAPRVHHRLRDLLLAFVMGVWLALLQFSYFFMLEVHLSSRATSYFVAVFFWLIGFLIGLNLHSPRAFPVLLFAAPAAYYAAYAALRLFPYRLEALSFVGPCIVVAGMLAGSFFPHARSRFHPVKYLFLHENNGFVLGILLSLLGAVFAGRWLLALSAALGVAPIALLYWLGRRPEARPVPGGNQAI